MFGSGMQTTRRRTEPKKQSGGGFVERNQRKVTDHQLSQADNAQADLACTKVIQFVEFVNQFQLGSDNPSPLKKGNDTYKSVISRMICDKLDAEVEKFMASAEVKEFLKSKDLDQDSNKFFRKFFTKVANAILEKIVKEVFSDPKSIKATFQLTYAKQLASQYVAHVVNYSYYKTWNSFKALVGQRSLC